MKVLQALILVAACGYFAYYHFVEKPRRSQEGTVAGGPSAEALAMSPEALSGLAQLTTSKVVLFSTAWCPYCVKVKKLLGEQGVRYTEIDLERDPRGPAFQAQYMVVRGFPVTVIGSQIVPGYDERALLAALKRL